MSSCFYIYFIKPAGKPRISAGAMEKEAYVNADNVPLNLWGETRPWSQRLLMEAINGAIPASAIQQVLEKTQATGQRDRYLTGQVTVLMVLAICLWPTVCMRDCLRNLIEGCCQGLGRRLQQIPVKSAITAARNRLGIRPLRELFRLVVHPLATNATQGAFYKGLRLVSFDGSVLNVPDTPANERAFGRPGSSRGRAAFPQLRLVWFMEVATRATLDFIAVPSRRAEATVIPRLFRSLKEGMLVLWDRGFHSYKLYTSVMHTGAHLLARVQARLIFNPVKRLPDGSFLAKLYPSPSDRRRNQRGIIVRIIEYTINDTNRPGYRQKHRLITTLLDADLYPVLELICLYHERWEIEIGLDEIKVHQNENKPTLRSKTPRGVIQEVHGLMLLHFALCYMRHEAALTINVDPDRISFVHTLRVVRRAVTSFQIAPTCTLPALYKQMLGEITQEILPIRRTRCYPRVVKRKMSKFHVKGERHKHWPQPCKPFAQAIEVLK